MSGEIHDTMASADVLSSSEGGDRGDAPCDQSEEEQVVGVVQNRGGGGDHGRGDNISSVVVVKKSQAVIPFSQLKQVSMRRACYKS